MAFLFILGQALPARLVGGCGARAVSRKTPIYFILNLDKDWFDLKLQLNRQARMCWRRMGDLSLCSPAEKVSRRRKKYQYPISSLLLKEDLQQQFSAWTFLLQKDLWLKYEIYVADFGSLFRAFLGRFPKQKAVWNFFEISSECVAWMIRIPVKPTQWPHGIPWMPSRPPGTPWPPQSTPSDP